MTAGELVQEAISREWGLGSKVIQKTGPTRGTFTGSEWRGGPRGRVLGETEDLDTPRRTATFEGSTPGALRASKGKSHCCSPLTH